MTDSIFLAHMVFLAILSLISFMDMKYKVIPNVLSVGGLILALAAAICIPRLHATGSPRQALAEAFVGALAGLGTGLILRLAGNTLLKRQMERSGQSTSLGLGDVKLLAFLGAYLGIRAILPILLVACVTGALVGSVRKLVTGDSVLPFGPFLCLGAFAQIIPVFITAIK